MNHELRRKVSNLAQEHQVRYRINIAVWQICRATPSTSRRRRGTDKWRSAHQEATCTSSSLPARPPDEVRQSCVVYCQCFVVVVCECDAIQTSLPSCGLRRRAPS